jgi:phosphoribosyl 1,2-cyclic phosphodiesterase
MAVLGSGSSGNSTILVFENGGAPRRILIDAGLSPRETARRLHGFGIHPAQIDHILITHVDHDHFRETWTRACERWAIDVHAHLRHCRGHSPLRGLARRLHGFNASFELGQSIRVTPLGLAHDSLGSTGYLIEHDGRRLGFATDLGRVSDGLHDYFVDLDLIAIESNYDRTMQLESARPPFLKRRIMGGAGHLSNEQALDAVLAIASRCRLQHIVLLHLSRQCNCPDLVRRLYEARAPELRDFLTISSQHAPTAMLALDREPLRIRARQAPFQPSLFAAAV